ncbi:MAG TPA: hypothetical protein VFO77_08400, partial [Actinoplanes sp.]|nr:hypothetical protein [Actinoplanes sp.]
MPDVVGTTNWDAYGMDALWAMVADDDFDANQNLSAAWQAMAQTVDQHRKDLERARQALEQAWPPEHNEGAARYVEVLAGLTASLDETAHRSWEISTA